MRYIGTNDFCIFGHLHTKIDNREIVEFGAKTWQNNRNIKDAKINWQFTTKDARIKLHGLYPSIDA